MATTITNADLTVKILEKISLNGKNQGSTNTTTFSDIDTSELFWLRNDTTNGDLNNCHRKLDENEAQNTKTREVISIQGNTKIFQKI